jgi:hypothetical protein
VSSSQLEPGNTTTPNFIFFLSDYAQKYGFLLNFLIRKAPFIFDYFTRLFCLKKKLHGLHAAFQYK